MTLAEYRSHLSVWAVLASPMILGADLRTITKKHPECLALLLNPEIVAVNQDPGVHVPWLVLQTTNSSDIASTNIISQIFARPLGPVGKPPDAIAVVLLNRAETASILTVSWAELGIPEGK